MSYIPLAKIIQRGQTAGLQTGSGGTVIDTRSFSVATVSLTRHSVAFPVQFDVVPTVVVNIEGNSAQDGHSAILHARIEDGTVTTNGFNVLIADMDSSQGVRVNWIATVGIQ